MGWFLFVYLISTHQLVYHDNRTLYNSHELCNIDGSMVVVPGVTYARCRPVTLPKEWKLR